MPLIKRKKVFGIKAEAVSGTAETITASHATMNAYDVEFSPELPVENRESQGTYDAPLQNVQTTRAGRITGRVDLIGGTPTAPEWYSHLALACGFSVSTLVATANGSENETTVTATVHQDGVRKKISGAMGSLTIPFEVGKPLIGNFDLLGKYEATADEAILAPTYITTVPARVASATLTIGAYTPKISVGSINIENELKLREDITDSTGFCNTIIVNQRITVDLDNEADLVANRDAYGLLLAGTTATLTLSVGSGGNALAFSIPGCQHIEVNDGDRGGIMTHPIKLLHTGSSAMTITSS